MNERPEQPATPEQQHQGIPGKALAAQREAMGWSVEQVADQLKLAVRQVVALENGDYDSLPSPAVTRGFVRAYAKILKMDAAPLVAMIEIKQPVEAGAGNARREKPATFSEVRFPTHGRRSGLPLGWIAGAVIVVVAGVAAWQFGLLPSGPDSSGGGVEVLDAPVPDTTPGSDTLLSPSVPLISVPAPNQNRTAPGTAAPGTNSPATPAQNAPGATSSPGGAATPGAGPSAALPPNPAAGPAPGAATPAATAAVTTAVGANPLVLTVREDSWIEVRPASGGRPLFSRLVKAGSTETIEVAEPVTLVVGNANGVSATLRGAALELPRAPGRTVSRVSLK
jgi:cytoskeleton protein RodZ